MLSGQDIFNRIYVELSPGGGGSGGEFIVECATDRDEWVTATVLSDSTSYLTQTGDIIFVPPLEWAYQSHSNPNGQENTEYGYWIRLKITDLYETNPNGNYIDLSYYFEGSQKIINKKSRIIHGEKL